MYSRAHIRISTNEEAARLVSLLNSDGTADKLCIEDKNGLYRVEARSLLGVLYFVAEHNNDTYLVNLTNDGIFPNGIDQFRPNIICS